MFFVKARLSRLLDFHTVCIQAVWITEALSGKFAVVMHKFEGLFLHQCQSFLLIPSKWCRPFSECATLKNMCALRAASGEAAIREERGRQPERNQCRNQCSLSFSLGLALSFLATRGFSARRSQGMHALN